MFAVRQNQKNPKLGNEGSGDFTWFPLSILPSRREEMTYLDWEYKRKPNCDFVRGRHIVVNLPTFSFHASCSSLGDGGVCLSITINLNIAVARRRSGRVLQAPLPGANNTWTPRMSHGYQFSQSRASHVCNSKIAKTSAMRKWDAILF